MTRLDLMVAYVGCFGGGGQGGQGQDGDQHDQGQEQGDDFFHMDFLLYFSGPGRDSRPRLLIKLYHAARRNAMSYCVYFQLRGSEALDHRE